MLLRDAALSYHDAGLTVLPNDPDAKYPRDLNGWQNIRVTRKMVECWFSTNNKAIGLRCDDEVEGVDIDSKCQLPDQDLWAEYQAAVEMLAPGLLARLPLERTPSGGYHIPYRCAAARDVGSMKLAQRPATPDELDRNPNQKRYTLIETRGTGGQFQAAPSPGYEMLRGSWIDLPTIEADERQILHDAARSLDQLHHGQQARGAGDGTLPGDRYNDDPASAGEALRLLELAGWRVAYRRGDAAYLCRPGKSQGVSASFGYAGPGVLYVFSTSAYPFEDHTAYSPFAIYATLEHNGDYKAAAKALAKRGYGTPRAAAPEQARDDQADDDTSAAITMLKKLGYSFALNDLNDTVEVNGKPIDDIVAAEMRVKMRRAGFKGMDALQDEIVFEAAQNRYHPISHYLGSLQWDGTDYIGQLAAMMESEDSPMHYADGRVVPLHALYLKRWLVGAVAKALDRKQNVMLVLAGPQNLGKSTFVRWLAGGVPDYHLESGIDTKDKDNDIRLMSHFIWEVCELDATTRKADVAALKAFITKHKVVVRKSYGKHDTTKPALCSLVGTVNNAGGFLNDETGNRRFLVTTITRLDWAYENLPIDQVWAQAVALYQAGEPWRLTEEEAAHQERQNQEYDVETPLEGWIAHFFEFTGRDDHRITLADVYDRLAERVRQTQKTDNEISRVLRKFGAERKRTGKARFYCGVHQRERVSGSTSDSLVTLSDTILSQANCSPQSDKWCNSDSSDTINGKTPKNDPEPESGDFSESVADKVSQVSHDATNGTTEPQEEVTHGVTDCHQDTVTAPEPSTGAGAAAPPAADQAAAAPAADGAAPDPAPDPEHDAALIAACGPMAADTRAKIAQARQNWRSSEAAHSQLCRVIGWDMADAIRAWVEVEKMQRAAAQARRE